MKNQLIAIDWASFAYSGMILADPLTSSLALD